LSQRKKRLTHKILTNQIIKGLKGIKKLNNILFAYEPIWSIGTGVIPNKDDLEKNIIFIKNKLRNTIRLKNAKVLYGGSVGPKNITILKKINTIDGFLIGGASKDSKKFIDIVKKTVI
jgi:triosephosphate isomerase